MAKKRPTPKTAQPKVQDQCVYCGCKEPLYLTKDHIKPKDAGGKDHSSNIQICCILCNQIKANQSEEDFKAMMEHFRGLQKLKMIVMHTSVSFGVHNAKLK